VTLFGGSQALWFVSRGSGLALLVAFSAVVVLGVTARLGSVPRRWTRLAEGELHRTLALFCVTFLGLHVLTAILDRYVAIGWTAAVVPFASGYRTLAIGLGALAVDFAGAVLITSLARQRLGYRAWRTVHGLAYLAWPASFAHAVTAGTDLRIWWVALTEWGCAAAVATAIVARLLAWTRGPSSEPPVMPGRAGTDPLTMTAASRPGHVTAPDDIRRPGTLPRLLPGSPAAGPVGLAGHLARYGPPPSALGRQRRRELIA
jgi:DMSO/TMAO reductase YedYZ heme-binding membrane subunit